MDSKTHLRRLQWFAADAFKDHVLRSELYYDEGNCARWLIGKPGTGVMLAEIFAGVTGSLIVHGDCDWCRFAHYSDHRGAWNRLCWMARCTDVDYYVAQKARIGSARCYNDHLEYDSEVADHDIRLYLTELQSTDPNPELVEVLTQALESVESETELRQFLADRDRGWDLWEHHFGSVTPAPVVFAHAALQRLYRLLEAKYGPEGPPT